MKKLFAAACCAAFLAISIGTICPAAELTDSSDVEKTVEEKKQIGEKKKGSLKAKLTNATGKEIRGFAIKKTANETFSENMLAEGDVFADGEVRVVYYMPENGDGGMDSEESDYTIQLTFSDDTTAELHTFLFSKMKKSRICLDESTAYLIYKDNGEKISTLETEQALAQEAAAASQDDGELVEYDDYYDDTSYYDDSSYYDNSASYSNTYYSGSTGNTSSSNTNTGSGNSSAASAGNGGATAEENCLQGGLMN